LLLIHPLGVKKRMIPKDKNNAKQECEDNIHNLDMYTETTSCTQLHVSGLLVESNYEGCKDHSDQQP
jgi:hypothetical protein